MYLILYTNINAIDEYKKLYGLIFLTYYIDSVFDTSLNLSFDNHDSLDVLAFTYL